MIRRGMIRRALRGARIRLGDDPRWLPLVLAVTPTGTSRRLTDRTRLVVEGFPRSGNTYAVYAAKVAEARAGRHLSVSSHVHTPSAVEAAVALHLPTLVVVRRPLDAVSSLLVAAPHVHPSGALAEWEHHHRVILPLRSQLVVATFDQVTLHTDDVLRRLDETFDTGLARFPDTPDARAEVFAAIDRRHRAVHGGAEHVLPRPSPGRAAARAAARHALLAATTAADRRRVDALYDRFEALTHPTGEGESPGQ